MCVRACARICKTTITEIEGMNLRGQGRAHREGYRKEREGGKLDGEVDSCPI